MATHVVSDEQRDTLRAKLKEIQRQVDQPSGSPLDPIELGHVLQHLTEGRVEHPLGYKPVDVLVHYYKGLAQLLSDAGLAFRSGLVTDHHLHTNPGRCQLTMARLVFMPVLKDMKFPQARQFIEDRCCRPARLRTMLEAAEKFPRLGCGDVWVYALGTRVDHVGSLYNSYYVPVIYGDGRRRTIDLTEAQFNSQSSFQPVIRAGSVLLAEAAELND